MKMSLIVAMLIDEMNKKRNYGIDYKGDTMVFKGKKKMTFIKSDLEERKN